MSLNIQRFWHKRSVTITEYDPTFKAIYLGNVVTAWAKGEGCTDKPLSTLWDNYCHSTKNYSNMKVTVTNAGLKAVTKEHGLTEYWAHRITYCTAHASYPKVFCWVYRHEGKKLKQELRCHAVLCTKEEHARNMAQFLNAKLAQALQEFRREKICRQKARLSLANSVYENPSLPRRKILLSTGTANYRPPIERCKSAPKLMVIEEERGGGGAINGDIDKQYSCGFVVNINHNNNNNNGENINDVNIELHPLPDSVLDNGHSDVVVEREDVDCYVISSAH